MVCVRDSAMIPTVSEPAVYLVIGRQTKKTISCSTRNRCRRVLTDASRRAFVESTEEHD